MAQDSSTAKQIISAPDKDAPRINIAEQALAKKETSQILPEKVINLAEKRLADLENKIKVIESYGVDLSHEQHQELKNLLDEAKKSVKQFTAGVKSAEAAAGKEQDKLRNINENFEALKKMESATLKRLTPEEFAPIFKKATGHSISDIDPSNQALMAKIKNESPQLYDALIHRSRKEKQEIAKPATEALPEELAQPVAEVKTAQEIAQEAAKRAKKIAEMKKVSQELAALEAKLYKQYHGTLLGWLKKISNQFEYNDLLVERDQALLKFQEARAEVVKENVNDFLDHELNMVSERAKEFEKEKRRGEKVLEFLNKNAKVKLAVSLGLAGIGYGMVLTGLGAPVGLGILGGRRFLVGATSGMGTYNMLRNRSVDKSVAELSRDSNDRLDEYAKDHDLGFIKKRLDPGYNKLKQDLLAQDAVKKHQTREALDEQIAHYESVLVLRGKSPTENNIYMALQAKRASLLREEFKSSDLSPEAKAEVTATIDKKKDVKETQRITLETLKKLNEQEDKIRSKIKEEIKKDCRRKIGASLLAIGNATGATRWLFKGIWGTAFGSNEAMAAEVGGKAPAGEAVPKVGDKVPVEKPVVTEKGNVGMVYPPVEEVPAVPASSVQEVPAAVPKVSIDHTEQVFKKGWGPLNAMDSLVKNNPDVFKNMNKGEIEQWKISQLNEAAEKLDAEWRASGKLKPDAPKLKFTFGDKWGQNINFMYNPNNPKEAAKIFLELDDKGQPKIKFDPDNKFIKPLKKPMYFDAIKKPKVLAAVKAAEAAAQNKAAQVPSLEEIASGKNLNTVQKALLDLRAKVPKDVWQEVVETGDYEESNLPDDQADALHDFYDTLEEKVPEEYYEELEDKFEKAGEEFDSETPWTKEDLAKVTESMKAENKLQQLAEQAALAKEQSAAKFMDLKSQYTKDSPFEFDIGSQKGVGSLDVFQTPNGDFDVGIVSKPTIYDSQLIKAGVLQKNYKDILSQIAKDQVKGPNSGDVTVIEKTLTANVTKTAAEYCFYQEALEKANSENNKELATLIESKLAGLKQNIATYKAGAGAFNPDVLPTGAKSAAAEILGEKPAASDLPLENLYTEKIPLKINLEDVKGEKKNMNFWVDVDDKGIKNIRWQGDNFSEDKLIKSDILDEDWSNTLKEKFDKDTWKSVRSVYGEEKGLKFMINDINTKASGFIWVEKALEKAKVENNQELVSLLNAERGKMIKAIKDSAGYEDIFTEEIIAGKKG